MSGLGMAQDMIKIGAYLPMTGAVAAYGDMEWSGIQIAHDMEPRSWAKRSNWCWSTPRAIRSKRQTP